NTCGISLPLTKPSELILKIIVGRQIPRRSQRAVRTPVWILSHPLTHFIHRVFSDRRFDDDLVMHMGDDRKACLLQPPHGFCQNISGRGLCAVLAEFSTICLLPGPAAGAGCISHAFKRQTHAPEAVWLEFWLQISELPAAWQHHPERSAVILETDPTGHVFFMGLHSLCGGLLHIPPEL